MQKRLDLDGEVCTEIVYETLEPKNKEQNASVSEKVYQEVRNSWQMAACAVAGSTGRTNRDS